MMPVAILFARSDSNYLALPGTDVFDIERDARTYAGDSPVVAHPPCRSWGRLRSFAKPRHDEKALAFFAVDAVRRCGGVLEHPACSSLWSAAGLPLPGQRDRFGGFTLPIEQWWFGHRAEKKTWLYVVGIEPRSVPVFPIRFGEPSHTVCPSRRRSHAGDRYRPSISKAEREHTPPQLASWLVDLARLCVRSSVELAA